MIKFFKILKKHLDSFSMFLLFFIILLSSLFYYIGTISSDIKNYDSYRIKFDKMHVLDYRIENYFLKKFRYLDNDDITNIVKSFDKNIQYLKNSTISKEFGIDIINDIEKIEKDFLKKSEIMEYFKTSNARVTNSIHNLYDMHKTIDKNYFNDREMQKSLSQFFFAISKVLMDMPFNRENLELNMNKFKKYGENFKELKYFYLNAKQFIFDIESINNYIIEKDNIFIDTNILSIQNKINNIYNKKREDYKQVTIVFFILAFLFLLILFITYNKVRRTTRELLAFRYAIENSDNVVVVTDINRKIEYVNEVFEKSTGYKLDEVLGKNPNILKSDLVNPSVFVEMNRMLDSGKKWQGELINRTKDGRLIYEKASIVPIFLDGELIKYLAIKLDITDYIKLQNKLQQSAVVYEMSGEGIIVTDANHKILSVNPAFINIFGYGENELIGNKPAIANEDEEENIFYKKIRTQLLINGRWSGKLQNKTKDGKIIPTLLTISVVRNKNKDIENFIYIYTNLEEIIEMEEKAEYLAYHDSLTNLPNRAEFERHISSVLKLAEIENNRVSIVFIDLDRFKVINDTLGHHVGDLMLIEIAKRIKSLLKNEDMLARIGGDEFVIILNSAKDKESVSSIMDEILQIVREPIKIFDYHLYTTISMGVVFYPDDGTEKGELIKHADSAMYYAKDKGKDNYQFYTEQLSIDVEARLSLEQELLLALDRKELEVYYQPQYSIEKRKISGAEALLRWHSKKLGWVSPEQFISIAEDTGAIVKIGYFVFERACKEYMNWKKLGLNVGNISINISSIQFREDDLFARIKNIIKNTGIEASCIEIEITENFIMEYSTTNITILEDLRALGCAISIDDFGTGYSSMSYMKSLSLDSIKIDKSFIMDLPDSTHDAEVSKAIIALSKSLGYKVIAEGIETVEQENFLREYECDIGQGYYFSKPLTGDDFINFAKLNS